MILLVHMIFGVAVATLVKSPYLAIILALLSHYFLDIFPHIEYDIEEIKNKDWKKSSPAFFRVFIDFLIGIFLIFIFYGLPVGKGFINYIYAFFAILPDGLSVFNLIFPSKFLNIHDYFHLEKVHFLKDNKKISIFWRISTQVLVVIISIYILR